MMKKIFGIICILVIIGACSDDSIGEGEPNPSPGEGERFERSSMLVNWADNIIIPAYTEFSSDLATLKASLEAFQSDVNETNLIELRLSWIAAYTTWQHVAMFEIGPAESLGYQLNMNIYPTDSEKIESFIINDNYDLSLSSNRDAKGFPALDYLINGLGENDAAIVTRYNGTEKEALFAYLNSVVDDMVNLTDSVLSEWTGGYRDTFVANDGASATASVDRLVNDYIFYFEKYLRAGKMGIPLGVFSGSPLPQNVEAYYKGDISKTLFLEGLNAVQNFFNGKSFGSNENGESLATYLNKLNSVKNGEDLALLINEQFDLAREAVLGLSTFIGEIENNNPPTDMLLAYDEVQKVVPLLKVDMVSAMSISIDFVDADGD
ncbi:imelysin family protein [Maribacter sp. PR1]|uniref:Imelysin family protein n=1 Tax=Maribacter cobaltidurans TaxID=1178778 RepID=A0ABU7IYT1_9FLAO|nr:MULTISPECIES: imelysin family protein [Maribacter]MDC6390328.1 imelysin family protein [Maribacter sp. PR1]MEE1977718.1 imelysin family protein [Maribacter cobaltidurans]